MGLESGFTLRRMHVSDAYDRQNEELRYASADIIKAISLRKMKLVGRVTWWERRGNESSVSINGGEFLDY